MKRTALAVLISGALAAPVWAQGQAVDGDTPEQGVARLSLMSGDVTVRRGDSGELIAGENNAPLVASDHVITGPGSRAEIQFDYANMIRLAPASEVRLGELEDRSYLIQVAAGMTTFRVLRDSSALVEISTPVVSVRPVERGTYRVMVQPDGSTEVTVRDGRAEIFSQRGSEFLREGQTLVARGTASDPEYMISSAIVRDDWDRWNQNRDNDLERSQSYRYVSRDIYGADDLDGYGRWVYDSPYGYVWVPSVAATWAPYRVGRWSYINYYGWTWISGDPWGWAPYHWGNWYSSPFGWAWYPGVVGPRYYWRPAVVGFFGWGSGSISIGFGTGWGFGNIGWVPLAPYEVYRPWYGRGFRNNTNITIVNNTNIVNVYRNARNVNGRIGVTGVRSDNFGRGRVDNNNIVQINNRDLTRAGDVRGRLPFEGNSQNRRFSDREARATPIAARTDGNQGFVVRPDRSGRNNAPVQGIGSNQRQGNPGNANTGVARDGNAGARNPAGGNPSIVRPNGLNSGVPTAGANTGGNAARSTSGWRRFNAETDNAPGNVLRPGNGNNRSEPRAQQQTPNNPSRIDRGNAASTNRQSTVIAPRGNAGNAAPQVGRAPQANQNGGGGFVRAPRVTTPRANPGGGNPGGNIVARPGGNPGGGAIRSGGNPGGANRAPAVRSGPGNPGGGVIARPGNSGGGGGIVARPGGGNPGGGGSRGNGGAQRGASGGGSRGNGGGNGGGGGRSR